MNKCVRYLTPGKHYFGESSKTVGNEIIEGNVIPEKSKFSFKEPCAICDLDELHSESGPDPANDYSHHTAIPFKLKSDNFYPVSSWGKDMDQFQRLIEKDLTQLATKVLYPSFTFADNLTKSERRSLQDLGSDSSIVIQTEDKGGLVVMLDSHSYKDEALHQ